MEESLYPELIAEDPIYALPEDCSLICVSKAYHPEHDGLCSGHRNCRESVQVIEGSIGEGGITRAELQ